MFKVETMDEMYLYNTSLPTLTIKKEDLGKVYPRLGSGGEGTVYRYDEKTAVKIFKNKDLLPLKFRKIEVMGKVIDEDLIVPKGLVGYEESEIIDYSSLDVNDFESFTKEILQRREIARSCGPRKEGVFMDLVDTQPKCKNFDKISDLKDMKKVLELFLKADQVMQRLHRKGFRIGDVKPQNILIDREWNPKFIDADNMAFGGFTYDLFDYRMALLEKTFEKKRSRRDNDIYLLSLMVLKYCMKDVVAFTSFYRDNQRRNLQKIVEYLKIDPVLKDGLRLIFSDAENKPYIGPILAKIGPEAFVFTKKEKMVLTQLL